MKSHKEMILSILIIIIILIIIGFIAFYIFYIMRSKELGNNRYYGKWKINSSQLIVADIVIYSNDDGNNKYILLDKDTIDVCYNSFCNKYFYKIKGQNITISDNNTYLSGENVIVLENDFLIIKKILKKKNMFK